MTPHLYNVILADCPWQYRDLRGADRGQNHGAAEAHYRTMTLDAIKALPVDRLAAPDCFLFLWATCPTLPDAFEVMRSWGFTYKTIAFCWVKTYGSRIDRKPSPTEAPEGPDISLDAVEKATVMGMGSYSRSNVELVLLGIKGHPKRVHAGVKQVVVARRERHSAKPEAVRERVVQLCGDIPRVELFARGPAPAGWHVWGNEATDDSSVPSNPLEWPLEAPEASGGASEGGRTLGDVGGQRDSDGGVPALRVDGDPQG